MEDYLNRPRFDLNDVADEVSEGNCKAVKNDNKTKTDNWNVTRHVSDILIFTMLSMI